MFEIIQKLAPAPPTGIYGPVAPLSCQWKRRERRRGNGCGEI